MTLGERAKPIGPQPENTSWASKLHALSPHYSSPSSLSPSLSFIHCLSPLITLPLSLTLSLLLSLCLLSTTSLTLFSPTCAVLAFASSPHPSLPPLLIFFLPSELLYLFSLDPICLLSISCLLASSALSFFSLTLLLSCLLSLIPHFLLSPFLLSTPLSLHLLSSLYIYYFIFTFLPFL